jgi:membrane protein YdbS with pleckstrin-like domain
MRSRLRPGEALAMEVRRHRLILAGPFAATLFLAACSTAAWWAGRPRLAPAAAIGAGAAAVWSLWRWLDWRADLWAVTSERVIDESGVLTARVMDSPLDTIHNVACVQTLGGRIFGYGTLNIQTAAEHGSTTIPMVADPEALREAILERRRVYTRGAGS